MRDKREIKAGAKTNTTTHTGGTERFMPGGGRRVARRKGGVKTFGMQGGGPRFRRGGEGPWRKTKGHAWAQTPAGSSTQDDWAQLRSKRKGIRARATEGKKKKIKKAPKKKKK